MKPFQKTSHQYFALAVMIGLSGCSTVDRLKNVGKEPPLSPIVNPTTTTGYRAVSLPMPFPEVSQQNPNSLWQPGSRTFFKDNRAKRVGDILTVNISISDNATLSNSTQRTRANDDTGSIINLGGLEQKLLKLLPAGASLANLINTTGASNAAGSGTIERSESLETSITAVIIQALPNGNLVIEGRQEVRINHEVRELIIAGVIRPVDIGADNSIDGSRIAEARISYGGRGVVSDVQQPRYGQQVLDILLPF